MAVFGVKMHWMMLALVILIVGYVDIASGKNFHEFCY
jgi:hypothetical protein